MRLPLLSLLAISTALVPTAFAKDESSVWRAFVSDTTTPQILVVDLASEAVIQTFPLNSAGSLYAGEKGTGVFAVQGSANQVAAFTTGLEYDDHGDHSDLKVTAPAAVSALAKGEKPTHFVKHDGKLAIFYDASGKVHLVEESDWLAGKFEPLELDSGKPHHGVAVPFGDGAIVSKPVAEDGKLPTGFNVFDENGAIIATTELCADVHGEATSGDTIAFGCSDGVLVASGAKPEFTLLPFTDLPEGRVGTLLGGENMEFFLGNYGTHAVSIIEPEADAPIRLVDLPAQRVHFILDRGNSRTAYLLLADGSVHEFDVVSAQLMRSATVTAAYATDGGHGVPMPRLAQAGETLLLTDPASGQVHKLDLKTFAVTGSIDLGGAPSSIAVVGGVLSDH
jgi:hypothetical protein